jgi:integrase
MDAGCDGHPVQANREKSLLSAVFTKAIEWGAAAQNPCKQVPRLHEQKRERYIAETEFQSVRALALPMMQTAMDLALLTGLRQGDLLPLEKRHLTDEGIDRAFDISSRVRQFVICNRQGKRYSSDGFSTIWDRLMRRAAETRAIAERFTSHDIRAKSLSDDTAAAATLRSGRSDPRQATRSTGENRPVRGRCDRSTPQEYWTLSIRQRW